MSAGCVAGDIAGGVGYRGAAHHGARAGQVWCDGHHHPRAAGGSALRPAVRLPAHQADHHGHLPAVSRVVVGVGEGCAGHDCARVHAWMLKSVFDVVSR